MRKTVIFMFAASVPVLNGCAPLSQAALVYTSKVQVGVNVAAATPENPGIELNLGVNAVDAAYVPVAVARPCPTNAAGDEAECHANAYPIHDIRGENEQHQSETKGAGTLLDAQRDLHERREEANLLRNQIVAAETVVNTADRRIDDITREIALIATEQPAAVGDTPQEPRVRTREELDASLQQHRALRSTSQGELPELRARLSRVEIMETAASAVVRRLEQERDRNHEDDTRDALSVFGSFNNSSTARGNVGTGGTDAGAGITLGKVFSTGVASQFLTRGIADSARTNSVAECLSQVRQTVAALPTPEQQVQMLRELAPSCSASPPRP